MRYSALSILLLLLLNGCISTPPPQYYTLDMTRSGQVHPAVNINIESIDVAAALQKESILIMASPTTVEYYAQEQWVAGLHELVPRKLEVEFGQKDDQLPTLGMWLSVLSFEQVDSPEGPKAHVSIDVTLRPPRQSRYSEPIFEKNYTVVRLVQDDTVDAVVEMLSRCLEELACEIAEDTRELAAKYNPE